MEESLIAGRGSSRTVEPRSKQVMGIANNRAIKNKRIIAGLMQLSTNVKLLNRDT